MAYKDSDQIANDSNYALGDYSFRIERSSVPGSTNDKIEAICTQGGKNARKSIQVPSSTQLDGWYVEANETEATVYAVVKVPIGGSEKSSDLDTSPTIQPIPIGAVSYAFKRIDQVAYPIVLQESFSGIGTAFGIIGGQSVTTIGASSSPGGSIKTRIDTNPSTGESYTSTSEVAYNQSFTHNGKTVYYFVSTTSYSGTVEIDSISVMAQGGEGSPRNIAWTMIYGTAIDPEYEEQTVLLGRFAIDLEDAGGVGPESGWTDPGDYDPDWEPEDPTHTLYVTVTGALSGRHNDPIVDPSYSYIPAGKDTVKDYGCGGDGGHGGGGGAGASTVVVHKFATNQANFKEITAIARRHGYGSGGGKGGKGGDGCILVYY